MEKKKTKYGVLAVFIKLGPKILSVMTKLFKSAKAIKLGLATTSLITYSYLFTWQFALIIMTMLFVHESGHVWAMRKRGIKTKGFYFIPFFGGAAVSEESFRTRSNEAYIALMGPVWGLTLSAVVMGIYFLTLNPMFAAAASWMALINLFNMIPVNPLDGGRITKSLVLSMGQNSGRFKKVPVIILTAVSALLLFIIASAKLWLFFFFGCIGFLEILLELFSNKIVMEPMPLTERFKYFVYTLVLSFSLYAIMSMTQHVPGADIAMDILRDK